MPETSRSITLSWTEKCGRRRTSAIAVRVMVQELVARGVTASSIGELLGHTRFRSLKGELHDADAVAEALTAVP